MSKYRALIVDDDVTVRSLTARALAAEQFACDAVADGLEAQTMLEASDYDVVVTDLRMPNQHGYALANRLLAQERHPVIVVFTGIDEPRLTRDLYAHGVDDVVIKPVDYHVFARRVKTLVERGARRDDESLVADTSAPESVGRSETPTARSLPTTRRIPSDLMERKLTQLAGILPMSQAALDVAELARDERCTARQLGAAIARDASFAVEILRMANSSFYNPSGQKVVELEHAVMRLGMRRVGEMAVATSALTALTTSALPWMDVTLAWRRSVAAGLAVDFLIERRGVDDDDEGLFLCALMHGLGRIALGMAFPDEYVHLVAECDRSLDTLQAREALLFPESHAAVMCRLLRQWDFPADLVEPLQYLAGDLAQLHELDPALRKKVLALKACILAGWLAVGEWERWDHVDFPPSAFLDKEPVFGLLQDLDRLRCDLMKVVHFRRHSSTGKARTGSTPMSRTRRRLTICPPGEYAERIVAPLVQAMGCVPRFCAPSDLGPSERALVFGDALNFGPFVADSSLLSRHVVLLHDTAPCSCEASESTIRLPCSFEKLRRACESIAEDVAPRAAESAYPPCASARERSFEIDA